MNNRFFSPLIFFTAFLAFIVIVLGAYTRLSDAGLGCPDWPGCYGQLTVPQTESDLQQASSAFPDLIVEPKKAWPEMIHRYVAGSLGLLVLLIGTTTAVKYRREPKRIILGIGLIALILFQAALGMWTVTLKLLPIVVMGHLLGGFCVLSLLWWLGIKESRTFEQITLFHRIKPFVLAAMALLILQIALGGWTSANYAALVCPDFPFCHGKLIPSMDFKEGFNVLMPLGANFEGGVMDHPARVAIQMMHRLGALLTTMLLGVVIFKLFQSGKRYYQRFAVVLGGILSLQVTLGILNVIWLLPLPNAVMHNGVAALLLITLLSLLTVQYE